MQRGAVYSTGPLQCSASLMYLLLPLRRTKLDRALVLNTEDKPDTAPHDLQQSNRKTARAAVRERQCDRSGSQVR